jgi:hypothetical protein
VFMVSILSFHRRVYNNFFYPFALHSNIDAKVYNILDNTDMMVISFL